MNTRLRMRAAAVGALEALAAAPGRAEAPAGDAAAGFFVRGAALYCHDDLDDARTVVEAGLTQFPEDGPLQRLRALLEQPPEESSSNESPPESSKEENGDSGGGEPPPDGEPEPEPGGGEPEPSTPEESEPPPESTEAEAGELSPDQLARLLEAAAEEELQLRDVLRRTLPPSLPVDKDW